MSRPIRPLRWLQGSTAVMVSMVAVTLAAGPAAVGQGNEPELQTVSQGRLKQLGTALLMYMQDYDEQLPSMKDAATAKSRLLPYVRGDEAVFINPRTSMPYAPNPAISERRIGTLYLYPHLKGRRPRPVPRERSLFGDPSQIVAFYEPGPSPDGTRGVLFLNGRVRRIPETEWTRIKRLSRIPM
jgi:hypothetical protein